MEIQSFILCKEIKESGTGTLLDGRWLGIHQLFPVDSGYPLHGTLPFFMLLRRDHRAYEENFSLRFDLVDQDGRPAGQPAGFKHTSVFPAGERFFHFCGDISFIIPAPGDYRLDITADEEGSPFVYAYNIEATQEEDTLGKNE
jgi:hypothetical protein